MGERGLFGGAATSAIGTLSPSPRSSTSALLEPLEAYRDGLAQVHREVLIRGGDAHEPVAVAELGIGEAEFLGPEQERGGRQGQDA